MSSGNPDLDATPQPPVGRPPAGSGTTDLSVPPVHALGTDTAADSARQTIPDPKGSSRASRAGREGALGEAPLTSAEYRAPGHSGRTPRFLGEYEILEEIARGGMGIVYRARQEKLHRLVALKLIRDGSVAGPSELRRFRAEAEAIAQLDHPHIVPIYEIGQIDDQPYFSMRLITGGSLTDYIPRIQDDARAAATLMAKVARAVHYAHQRTILHRDIKPSNILIDESGEPYVTDFGLAKRIGTGSESAATMTGAVIGTPAYMPPEQASGGTKSVTTAADVYSLGATLYTALTGQPPFAGDSAAAIMRQVIDQDPTRPRSLKPKLDRDLETICLKCLSKEQARRYGSAEALAEDIERWLTGMPIVARPVSAAEKVVKWVKRQRALAAVVIMLLLALVGLIGGGIWFTYQLSQERDLANRGRYAAEINLARNALDDGLVFQVREQLKVYATGPKALASLRSFEWYYLAKLCDPAPIRLRGHRDTVICVAFHPDGNRIASGSADGSVRVWDLNGRRSLNVYEGSGGAVPCVAFSPDGRWLAAGDERGSLRVWELATGQERHFQAHRSRIGSVVFSPKSSRLLSCDAARRVVEWDVNTGKPSSDELRHGHDEERKPSADFAADRLEQMGQFAAYALDGKCIVTLGHDQWVMVWDAATHELRDQVQTGNIIIGFSISPDGRQLALAEQKPDIDIFDLTRLRARPRAVSGFGQEVSAVAYGPDGGMLSVAGKGSDGGLVDAETGKVFDRFGQGTSMAPFSQAFRPTGDLLARAVGTEVRVVPAKRSLSGTTLVADAGPIRRLAISPDEALLALGREDGKITVWDVRAGRVLQTLTGHESRVFGVAFVPGPAGPQLVSVGGDGWIKIWDPEAGGPPRFQAGDGVGAVYAVAARPDGKQIATGGDDGYVHTWDPATGRADLPPFEHGAAVRALAYDSRGTLLASGGMDRTVRAWSATTGRQRLGPLENPRQLSSLAFSPNGRLLAAGGGTSDGGGMVIVCDAASGGVAAKVECPRGVDALSFSPDSRRIATCGTDTIVQVWDATGGHETLSLTGHTDRVSAVLFAPDALRLYSAGRDGVVKLWDGSPTAE